MSIAAPGRRLLQHIPLRFVARKVAGGGQRPLTSSLSLTSMIDFLVVTVVFLLIMFDPAQSAAANGTNLPPAVNVETMIDAPMVTVAGTRVLLDGAPVGDLEAALVAKRETWKQVYPNRPFPGAVVLEIDQDVPSHVVKDLFRTASSAGYPAISFMVEREASR